MPIRNEFDTILISDWTIRYRVPSGNGPYPVVWLFHGWMGDEESMSIFASLIPEQFLVLAPRGLYRDNQDGYGWYQTGSKGWPSIETFKPAINKLDELMANWPVTAPWADFSKMRLAGFSQGGALAFAYAILFPEKFEAVASLAGFLPVDSDEFLKAINLKDLQIYISHGREDKLVPIENTRNAVAILKEAGAKVTFCESDVGHKLSKDCFNGLEVFFEF